MTTLTKPEELSASTKPKQFNYYHLYSSLLPLIPNPITYTIPNPFLKSSLAISPRQIEAIYDEITKTIWVQSEQDMITLWRKGFFGKGALSRSEPSWKRRVENKLIEANGGVKNLTSEEMTAQRRRDRKVSKLVKKAEREAEKLAAASAAAVERNSSTADHTPGGLGTNLHELVVESVEDEEQDPEETREDDDEDNVAATVEAVVEEISQAKPTEIPPLWQLSAEHTQLQQEEAFFLQFALGCLSLRSSCTPLLDSNNTTTPLRSAPFSILQSWSTFLLDSATLSPTVDHSLSSSTTIDPRLSRWDSPFLLNYVAYHHYRSMGWVVRSGIKFCADWVLYGSGGPVGGHAEFAVVLIPTYLDPQDELSCPFYSSNLVGQRAEGENRKSWRWFNTVNRVCSGVKKTLVLLYITIPPLSTLPSPNFIAQNPALALSKFTVREVTVRRWIAGRMRD